jgi:hypothetical protein
VLKIADRTEARVVELNKLKADRKFADVRHLHTTVKKASWWAAAFGEFGFQLVGADAHLDRFLLSRGAASVAPPPAGWGWDCRCPDCQVARCPNATAPPPSPPAARGAAAPKHSPRPSRRVVAARRMVHAPWHARGRLPAKRTVARDVVSTDDGEGGA